MARSIGQPTITPLRMALDHDGRRQDWLAVQVGAHPVEVSRWVRGVHRPMAHTRVAIAEALGRDVFELWPDHDTDGTPANSGREPVQTSPKAGERAA